MSSRNKTLVGRLAPSPTGAQHIGNARTYLLAWLSTRTRNGTVRLRIEDIDSPRVKPAATEQIIVDLQWLGLDWDDSPIVQSDRMEMYQHALSVLQQKELVYPCTCTRKDIELAASAPHVDDHAASYPDTCAHRNVSDAKTLESAYCWRFRVPDRLHSLTDLFWGEKSYTKGEIGGDFVVWKNNDTPAYQLAVVVDDAAQEITEVVRGDDLLTSTPRQLMLYEALGSQVPSFVHVPLVVGTDGRRLAKRHGDTRLSALRDHGVKCQDFLGLLAWSCGWQPQITAIAIEDMFEIFNWHTIPRGPFVLKPEHLKEIGYET